MYVLVLSVNLSKLLSVIVSEVHSGTEKPVRVKMLWCVLIAVGVPYVNRSTPDVIVGVSN